MYLHCFNTSNYKGKIVCAKYYMLIYKQHKKLINIYIETKCM